MVVCDYVGFVGLFFFCSTGIELGSPWKQGIFSLRATAPVLCVAFKQGKAHYCFLFEWPVAISCIFRSEQLVVLTILLL